MYSKRTTVENATGLHARPASDFIAVAKKYQSKIKIKNLAEDVEADAKSIIMLLSLGVSKGTEVELTANGVDEVEAVEKLVELIDSKFGEE